MDLHTRTPFILTLLLLTLSERTVGQNSSNSTLPPGCGGDLNPEFYFLCDLRSAWGIVVQVLTALGFLISLGLLLAVLVRWMCVCGPCGRRGVRGAACASTALFLLAVAGIFALPYSFVVGLTEQTCPVRVFLFGVLFGLAFACLLARVLAVRGCRGRRGWTEPGLALALALVQVVIAVEWLLVVMVRDRGPCSYSQEEFIMLLIYVMVLLAVATMLSLRFLCNSASYSSSDSQWPQYHGRLQGALLSLTLLLSVAIWVVWIALLTRGNRELGHRPSWDDPVISIALTANGWVLLLGHGFNQVRFMLCSRQSAKNQTADFSGWISPMDGLPNLHAPKNGADNPGYHPDSKDRGGKGKGVEPVLRSPYESSFSMSEIDPNKDYTIPRPQTTNITQPYDDYYQRLP
ncbi:G-protein coupled receptor family C group 5 member D [Astyanax mexicanus]|uniref:G-protein coupled receptor family C group 5 member D-like n=1 Tax=Astyanax mexicanus TaxID=7994 RepID=W5KU22_ASTMX|nr:G-protein coupled receptor family C group 5 member D [Astyanax mexicanus]